MVVAAEQSFSSFFFLSFFQATASDATRVELAGRLEINANVLCSWRVR